MRKPLLLLAALLPLPIVAQLLVPVINSGLTMPPSALGIWYHDQFQSSPVAYVPNAVNASVPASLNYLHAPRHLFNNTNFWTASSLTVVDNAATSPDGKTEASTINGTGFIFPANSPTHTGTNTMGCNVKSNTGSSQTFEMAFFELGTAQIFTATTSWQRFSLTATGSNHSYFFARSPDHGTTAINLQIVDCGVFSGASDLGADVPVGHMYFGADSTATAPALSSGSLNFNAGPFGVAQFYNQTFTAYTVIAVGSKVVNDVRANPAITDIKSFTNFQHYFDNSNALFNQWGLASTTPPQTTAFWLFYNTGFHAIGSRYDGATRSLWLDDSLLVSDTPSVTNPTMGDFGIGYAAALKANYKMTAIAFWPRALSDAEYRDAYNILASRAAARGNSITPERILIAEGDSIPVGFNASNGGYPKLFAPNASPPVHGGNFAVSGSVVADLVTRSTSELKIIPPNGTSGRKYIYAPLIGHNDLALTSSVSTYLTNYAALLDLWRARGAITVCATLLPSTVSAFGGGSFNTARNTSNATVSTWVGTGVGKHCSALIDFAADATMGTDAAASDTGLYPDGIHPSNTGQTNLEVIFRAAINAI